MLIIKKYPKIVALLDERIRLVAYEEVDEIDIKWVPNINEAQTELKNKMCTKDHKKFIDFLGSGKGITLYKVNQSLGGSVKEEVFFVDAEFYNYSTCMRLASIAIVDFSGKKRYGKYVLPSTTVGLNTDMDAFNVKDLKELE